jgi:hypothetical protein
MIVSAVRKTVENGSEPKEIDGTESKYWSIVEPWGDRIESPKTLYVGRAAGVAVIILLNMEQEPMLPVATQDGLEPLLGRDCRPYKHTGAVLPWVEGRLCLRLPGVRQLEY